MGSNTSPGRWGFNPAAALVAGSATQFDHLMGLRNLTLLEESLKYSSATRCWMAEG
jgi:hypothetical protein